MTLFADLIVVVALLKMVKDRNLSPLKISLRGSYGWAATTFLTGLMFLNIFTSIKNHTCI
tara:strand:+ start:630 stop:809 length:180 start_codon:yes stop_codon:yes gene_type:complete